MTDSSPSVSTRARSVRGFTLVELAVVLAIVGLLLGSILYTLSAQVEARNFSETNRRLEQARELLLAYVVVHGRLPCPATLASNGVESIATAAASGTGGTCSAYYAGYLPAVTLGFSPTNDSGAAIDAWGNGIRYAVSATSAPHFTSNEAILSNWSSISPADLDVCKHLTSVNATTCGSAGNRVATQGTVVAVIWSQGKNALSSASSSVDESNNNDNFPAFVSRGHSPAEDTTLGEFDDQLVWLPVGMVYGRLISAGKLP